MSKLTAKQEAFCLEYVKGANASEAYRAAYGAQRMKAEVIHVEASRLLKNPNVSLRIDELREPPAKEAQLTLASHLAELQRLKEAAEAHKNHTVAVRAEELRGRAAGFYVDRKEIRSSPLNTLTDDQLRQLLAGITAELPAEAIAALGLAGTGAADQGEPPTVVPPLH